MAREWPAFPGGWWSWLINPRPAPSRGPRRVAGVMATRNYTDACSAFDALSRLVDVTIVLDDNSSRPFPHASRCGEYLSLRNGVPWNATANLSLLFHRAYVHGCEWVVNMDDDLLFGERFQARTDVDEVIDRMTSDRLDIWHFRLKDLWESPERFRSDGRWSEKTFPVVRRNWFFYRGIALQDPASRLHAGSFPSNLRARWAIDDRRVVYHTGCISEQARRERVEKYRREDSSNQFQSDYSYMLNEDGLRLEPLPDADLAAIRGRFRPDLLQSRD